MSSIDSKNNTSIPISTAAGAASCALIGGINRAMVYNKTNKALQALGTKDTFTKDIIQKTGTIIKDGNTSNIYKIKDIKRFSITTPENVKPTFENISGILKDAKEIIKKTTPKFILICTAVGAVAGLLIGLMDKTSAQKDIE